MPTDEQDTQLQLYARARSVDKDKNKDRLKRVSISIVPFMATLLKHVCLTEYQINNKDFLQSVEFRELQLANNRDQTRGLCSEDHHALFDSKLWEALFFYDCPDSLSELFTCIRYVQPQLVEQCVAYLLKEAWMLQVHDLVSRLVALDACMKVEDSFQSSVRNAIVRELFSLFDIEQKKLSDFPQEQALMITHLAKWVRAYPSVVRDCLMSSEAVMPFKRLHYLLHSSSKEIRNQVSYILTQIISTSQDLLAAHNLSESNQQAQPPIAQQNVPNFRQIFLDQAFRALVGFSQYQRPDSFIDLTVPNIYGSPDRLRFLQWMEVFAQYLSSETSHKYADSIKVLLTFFRINESAHGVEKLVVANDQVRVSLLRLFNSLIRFRPHVVDEFYANPVILDLLLSFTHHISDKLLEFNDQFSVELFSLLVILLDHDQSPVLVSKIETQNDLSLFWYLGKVGLYLHPELDPISGMSKGRERMQTFCSVMSFRSEIFRKRLLEYFCAEGFSHPSDFDLSSCHSYLHNLQSLISPSDENETDSSMAATSSTSSSSTTESTTSASPSGRSDQKSNTKSPTLVLSSRLYLILLAKILDHLIYAYDACSSMSVATHQQLLSLFVAFTKNVRPSDVFTKPESESTIAARPNSFYYLFSALTNHIIIFPIPSSPEYRTPHLGLSESFLGEITRAIFALNEIFPKGFYYILEMFEMQQSLSILGALPYSSHPLPNSPYNHPSDGANKLPIVHDLICEFVDVGGQTYLNHISRLFYRVSEFLSTIEDDEMQAKFSFRLSNSLARACFLMIHQVTSHTSFLSNEVKVHYVTQFNSWLRTQAEGADAQDLYTQTGLNAQVETAIAKASKVVSFFALRFRPYLWNDSPEFVEFTIMLNFDSENPSFLVEAGIFEHNINSIIANLLHATVKDIHCLVHVVGVLFPRFNYLVQRSSPSETSSVHTRALPMFEKLADITSLVHTVWMQKLAQVNQDVTKIDITWNAYVQLCQDKALDDRSVQLYQASVFDIFVCESCKQTFEYNSTNQTVRSKDDLLTALASLSTMSESGKELLAVETSQTQMTSSSSLSSSSSSRLSGNTNTNSFSSSTSETSATHPDSDSMVEQSS